MIRLFAAIFPSEQAVEHLVTALRPFNATSSNELRWTDPDNWHLTLSFYGAQPNDASLVKDQLSAAAAMHSALDLHLSGAGLFDRRTAWVGVGGQRCGLKSLMADCLLPGTPEEERRRQRAHLTFARTTRRTRDAWLLEDHIRTLSVYRGPDFVADQICLVQSHLGEGRGGGPRYEVLERFYLR